MRDFGKVYSTFWTSRTTRNLSDRARLLAVYLLCGPHTNMIGCFRLPDGYVMEDLGWKSETVSKGFMELFRNGFATRDEGSKWVLVSRYLKWNPIENPNQGKSAARLFEQIPSDLNLKRELARHLAQQGDRFPQTVLEPFLNGFETLSKPGEGEGEGTGEGNREGNREGDGSGFRRFQPPSVDEVKEYCQERGSTIDPEHFVAHYSANGWCQSNGRKIKDWKAAVVTWEKNQSKFKNTPAKDNAKSALQSKTSEFLGSGQQ